MPNNIGPEWIKKILFHLIGGGVIGKLFSVLLGLFLVDEKWALFLQLWVPVCAIAGLLIVLRDYQKDKDDTLQ